MFIKINNNLPKTWRCCVGVCLYVFSPGVLSLSNWMKFALMKQRPSETESPHTACMCVLLCILMLKCSQYIPECKSKVDPPMITFRPLYQLNTNWISNSPNIKLWNTLHGVKVQIFFYCLYLNKDGASLEQQDKVKPLNNPPTQAEPPSVCSGSASNTIYIMTCIFLLKYSLWKFFTIFHIYNCRQCFAKSEL